MLNRLFKVFLLFLPKVYQGACAIRVFFDRLDFLSQKQMYSCSNCDGQGRGKVRSAFGSVN